MAYLYDDLLTEHFKKTAFWGALARGAMKMAPGAAKFGLGAATGIPVGGAGAAGAAFSMAKGVMPTANRAGIGPSIGGFGAKTAASRREKVSDAWMHRIHHALPYLGFIAAHELDSAGHPNIATGVNLAALADLGLQTGAKGTPDKMDLAGLGLMGGSELMRLKNRLTGK